MKIVGITESGCSNILKWAIKNEADILSDDPLRALINEELFFLVTYSDVNFLELFRLVQRHRNKVRINNIYKAEVPGADKLAQMFPGNFDDPDGGEKSYPLLEAAENVTVNMINIVLQMEADDDIISRNAIELYLPMISRRFDVQIPVAFEDVIYGLNQDSIKEIFNTDYPKSLETALNNEQLRMTLELLFVKLTGIIRYDKRLDSLIEYTKFVPLTKYPQNNKLYKVYMLDFFKFASVSRGQIKCSLFNPAKEDIMNALRRMKTYDTPLNIDFAIQLPIQLMEELLFVTGPDMLPISCESSMSSIIKNGMIFNDFVAPNRDTDSPDSTEAEITNNAISAYKVRLTEANQLILNTINLIMNSKNEIDVTGAFALLPAMYTTKAVITVSEDKLEQIKSNLNNEVLKEMFQEISKIFESVNSDIEASENK